MSAAEHEMSDEGILGDLSDVDTDIRNQLEKDSIQQTEDPLVYSWVQNVRAAYAELNNQIVDVALRGEDPETAIDEAEEVIEEGVISPLYNWGVLDRVSQYGDFNDLFGERDYRSPEDDPMAVEQGLVEEVSGTHPNILQLKERYDDFREYCENVADSEEQVNWQSI